MDLSLGAVCGHAGEQGATSVPRLAVADIVLFLPPIRGRSTVPIPKVAAGVGACSRPCYVKVCSVCPF